MKKTEATPPERRRRVAGYAAGCADMTRPHTFNCPMDVTSGRVLSFAHLEGGSTQFVGATQGTVAFTVNACRIARTADGSLVVMLQTGVGGLIGPVPVGHFKRAWYLFGPMER